MQRHSIVLQVKGTAEFITAGRGKPLVWPPEEPNLSKNLAGASSTDASAIRSFVYHRAGSHAEAVGSTSTSVEQSYELTVCSEFGDSRPGYLDRRRLQRAESEQPVRFEVQVESYGYEAPQPDPGHGGFARISVNGRDVLEQHGRPKRGFNCVRVQRDGTTTAKCFDTWEKEDESDKMLEWVQKEVDAGDVVLVAVVDEASWHVTDAAYEALELLGSVEFDRESIRTSGPDELGVGAARLGHRVSYALVGRKGAASPLAEAIGSIKEPVIINASWVYRNDEALIDEQSMAGFLGRKLREWFELGVEPESLIAEWRAQAS